MMQYVAMHVSLWVACDSGAPGKLRDLNLEAWRRAVRNWERCGQGLW